MLTLTDKLTQAIFQHRLTLIVFFFADDHIDVVVSMQSTYRCRLQQVPAS